MTEHPPFIISDRLRRILPNPRIDVAKMYRDLYAWLEEHRDEMDDYGHTSWKNLSSLPAGRRPGSRTGPTCLDTGRKEERKSWSWSNAKRSLA